MAGPRVLIYDLESSPNLADVWGLWQQNVSLNQLRESGGVISFAAKWLGEKPVMFHSDHHDGHKTMIKKAHRLFHQADILVGYNHVAFDNKHMRREFLLCGLDAPSPAKNVDLLAAVKAAFRFPSNKLQHVSTELGIGSKTAHAGHELWQRCMAGDPKAWAVMRRYNMQDVALTERLYLRLRDGGWLPNHPNVGLWSDHDGPVCHVCQSERLQRRGKARTSAGTYQRHQCQDCGTWGRGVVKVSGVATRGIR